MRLYLAIFAFFGLLSGLSAQGIDFSREEWSTLLARAKQENKLIFVDAYAEWCGPCKMMDRKIFSDERVGAYYNATFVNAKIDMEKGEGPELAQEYGVRAYPTFLFINGEGELVHQGLGYQPVETFLELGRAAAEGEGLGAMRTDYENGNRDPEFLYDYAQLLVQSDDPLSGEVAKAYMDTQQDWSSYDNMAFILDMTQSTESALFTYLVQHRKDFIAAFGSGAVNNRIQTLVMQQLLQGHSALPGPEEMEVLYRQAYPEMAPMLIANFRVNYYAQAGDEKQFVPAAIAYAKGYAWDDADQLNNLAWRFYETIDDTKALKEALKMAKRSVKLDRQYMNLDTLAALYYKLGKFKQARAEALAAIELAKQNQEDYSSTQQLLQEIENEL